MEKEMIVTDDNKKFILEAMKVDFLTEQWEIEQYAAALMEADSWRKKVDIENNEYKLVHKLIDKYNI